MFHRLWVSGVGLAAVTMRDGFWLAKSAKAEHTPSSLALPIQFMNRSACMEWSARYRAAYDESLSVAGPLTPQWVRSSIPLDEKRVPAMPKQASCTTVPARALSGAWSILNVYNDGTGGTIPISIPWKIPSLSIVGHPPMEMTTQLAWNGLSLGSVNDNSYPPADGETELT